MAAAISRRQLQQCRWKVFSTQSHHACSQSQDPGTKHLRCTRPQHALGGSYAVPQRSAGERRRIGARHLSGGRTRNTPMAGDHRLLGPRRRLVRRAHASGLEGRPCFYGLSMLTKIGPLTLRIAIERWPVVAPFRITGYTWEAVDVVLVTL